MKRRKSGTRQEITSETRRDFLKQSSLLTALVLTPAPFDGAAASGEDSATAHPPQTVTLTINGRSHSQPIEPRVTLLDLLREQLDLTGTKKGCDYGQCGACTVHVNGQRVLACLTLAVMANGKDIRTIEGLTREGATPAGATPAGADPAATDPAARLHPVQAAFLEHDGFQCGYCTPGQIMSAVGCLREGHANSKAEISEYMSGNICRCGAYANIVEAIWAVKQGGQRV
ncbi:(2Fe-2S)-binding protein [Tellurirhabdus rosea]|uniref:(2Fe-2S)-binding protein n=1 Tax=Tellurirhabdus rosea TaxID=2674997 RepID=UPI002252CDED|nr:(2Fe-2S)-binding protein [Tellurirhabdus rosea]